MGTTGRCTTPRRRDPTMLNTTQLTTVESSATTVTNWATMEGSTRRARSHATAKSTRCHRPRSSTATAETRKRELREKGTSMARNTNSNRTTRGTITRSGNPLKDRLTNQVTQKRTTEMRIFRDLEMTAPTPSRTKPRTRTKSNSTMTILDRNKTAGRTILMQIKTTAGIPEW